MGDEKNAAQSEAQEEIVVEKDVVSAQVPLADASEEKALEPKTSAFEKVEKKQAKKVDVPSSSSKQTRKEKTIIICPNPASD